MAEVVQPILAPQKDKHYLARRHGNALAFDPARAFS